MSGSAYEATCPICGRVFTPPKAAIKFFCPQCGMQMTDRTAPMTPEEAQAQAMRAVEQAARASQMATQAAKLADQADQRPQSVEEANRAVQQAMEAVRMAQEAQRAQERQAKLRQEEIARKNEELERRRVSMETQHRRQAEEDRQRATASDQRQSTTQQQVAAPQTVEYRRGVNVRHTNGCGLFKVTIPTNWAIQDTAIRQSSTRRYNPYVKFTDNDGTSIILRLGDAGTRLSSGMQALMNTYGSAIAGIDTTNYASMPNPINIADTYVTSITKQAGATNVRLVRDVPSSDLQQRQSEAYRLFKDAGNAQGNALIRDPFAAEVLRVYELILNGEHVNYAVYVRLYAVKDASGVENLSPVGLMFNAGSALGGLFGNKKKQRQSQEAQRHPTTLAAGTPWSIPDYNEYVQNGTVYWDVCGFSSLAAPARKFEEVLNTAFVPLVRSYDIHPDIINIANADARQEAMMIQQATNRQINAMNMQTQATLAAARQASAASTARTEAYLRQSDAHHQAFRERTNAQFNTSYGGYSAPDYSEAIRGVNTFMTSDGREVELDVSADRAYENQAGDVIGGSGGFDPGADWTEIPRA